jgi:hypothetical protein
LRKSMIILLAVSESQLMPIDPMRVYVLWAPSRPGAEDPGCRLARALQDRLDAVGMIRDGVGFRIPVRQRSRPWRPGTKPRPIDFSAGRSNVILVVQDDVMRNRGDWAEYVAELASQIDARGGADLLLPVTTSRGHSLPALTERKLQGIMAFTPDAGEAAWSRWLRSVTMYAMGVMWVHQRTARRNRNEAAAGRDSGEGPPHREDVRRITVFLSHAKRDGEGAALLLERFRTAEKRRRRQ